MSSQLRSMPFLVEYKLEEYCIYQSTKLQSASGVKSFKKVVSSIYRDVMISTEHKACFHSNIKLVTWLLIQGRGNIYVRIPILPLRI